MVNPPRYPSGSTVWGYVIYDLFTGKFILRQSDVGNQRAVLVSRETIIKGTVLKPTTHCNKHLS